MNIRIWPVVGLLCLTTPLLAEEPKRATAGEDAAPAEDGGQAEVQPADPVAAFEASLNYQQGEIILNEGLATLQVPATFRYLNAADTDRILQLWGNPPNPNTLGMLVPAETSPLDELGWGVIIGYEEDGHVDDEDAADLDFDDMLKTMQQATREGNKVRKEAGYSSLELVGWAEPPHYDATTHKLYWAKELASQDSSEHSLNYDIRILGRKGVLVLSAVSSMAQLPDMKTKMPEVLAFTTFNPGNTYADFDPDVDEVAAYGVGALIAGKVAAKAGFFKTLVALLIAGKKLVVAAVIALFVGIKRFLNVDDRPTK